MKPLIILFLLLTLVSPNFVLAQAGGSSSAPPPGTSGSKDTFVAPDFSSGYIAPGSGFVPCSGEGCSACDFVILANTIIKWLITISFLLFAVLAVMAGFKLVTSGGNPSARSAAKSSFTNAFIGLIIIMAAWLAVDTLLRGLLGKDGVLSDGQVSGYGPWSQVQCASQYSASNNTKFGEFADQITADVIPRYSASGDNRTALPTSQINARVAAINATPAVTSMTNAALDAAGITDPEQRKAYRALVSQESSNCVNKVGPPTRYGQAYGCVQMLVSTAREVDKKVSNRFSSMSDAQVAAALQNDNAYNITLGARYFQQGLQNNNNNIDYALARYNGGDGALRASRSCPGQTYYQCTANAGYAQTRNYVANIKTVSAGL